MGQMARFLRDRLETYLLFLQVFPTTENEITS
jgi:hypothetical protein